MNANHYTKKLYVSQLRVYEMTLKRKAISDEVKGMAANWKGRLRFSAWENPDLITRAKVGYPN
jgi:hypothetical protein